MSRVSLVTKEWRQGWVDSVVSHESRFFAYARREWLTYAGLAFSTTVGHWSAQPVESRATNKIVQATRIFSQYKK